MLSIITIPHPTLRQVAKPIEVLNRKTSKFITNLGDTLVHKKDPPGVGLAAPQVDVLKRVFTIYLPKSEHHHPELTVFINPEIVDRSEKQIFGETAQHKKPRFEGCLSMPNLYAPVPRWEWVEVTYTTPVGTEFQEKTERFSDFHARVIQHEYDHLEGVLFTDYALYHDLPVYEEDENQELVEIDKATLENV